MQTILHKLSILIAVLLVSISSYSYDFEVDGIYYNLISPKDLTCEVTEGNVKYKGDIVIPSEVTYNNRQLSVIAIGNGAFGSCRYLTCVTIPDSVTEIGEYAFYDCTSLTSVDIPDSVTEIGERAFRNCTSLTSVDIPDSVTEIGEYAFYDCTSLTSVVMPDSVTEIREGTFYGCTSLTSVNIPDSVIEIGKYAFRGCSSLTSMDIPDSVTEIREGMFYGCTSLTSVNIPDSVIEIGEYAFQECTSLTSVDVPDSVTEIGGRAFRYCTSLTSLTIGKSLDSFGEYEIQGCISLTKLRILHSDHSINLYCGDWLNQIKELYIDRPLYFRSLDGMTTFLALEKLELGESITDIKIKLYRSDNLTTIESYALVPPKLPEMSNTQYMNVEVFVPETALEAYKADPVWGNFWNIEGFEYDGVEDIKANTAQKYVISRFDLNGQAVSEDYQGLVIVRFSDGTTKKFIK